MIIFDLKSKNMKAGFLIQIFLLPFFALMSNNVFSQSDVIFVVNMSKDGVDYYKSRGAKEDRKRCAYLLDFKRFSDLREVSIQVNILFFT